MDLIGIKLGASKGMCSVIPNLRSKCPVTCGMKKDYTDTQDKGMDQIYLKGEPEVFYFKYLSAIWYIQKI